jgi:hypothetical protein
MALKSALVLLLLLVCLVTLTPLAFASPPDPTWMDGFFDDLDFDDVVVSLSWAAWAVEVDLLASLTPVPVSAHLVQSGEQPVRSTKALSAFLGRAPPLA